MQTELVITNRDHESVENALRELMAAFGKASEKHDKLIEELTKTRQEMAVLAASKQELSSQLMGFYRKQANGKGKKA